MTTDDWIKLASYATEIIKALILPVTILLIIWKFEDQIKGLLQRINKFSGAGVNIEMAEAQQRLKDKAKVITNTVKNKNEKEISKEKVQELIQKSLDEAFTWGLKVAGYNKPYEIKDFKILKGEDGNEAATWSEYP